MISQKWKSKLNCDVRILKSQWLDYRVLFRVKHGQSVQHHNMKRESKAYSYEEQLEELELKKVCRLVFAWLWSKPEFISRSVANAVVSFLVDIEWK
jgi:hypothetical protein